MAGDDRNSNATKVYSSSSDDAIKTASYGAQTDSRTDRTSTHNLGVGDAVQLAGAEYRIENIISGEKKSGEAIIYLIRDSQGNDYALKLYYPFRDPRDEPNSEALKRIIDINNPDILKLHRFGTGAEKFNGQFCYEISDFAKGGDLLKVENIKEKYTPEFIERHVIREIFKGIQVLHQNRIYHCDLKPQNVFYRDEQQTDLVIGDYGSAKTFEQSSEKELSYMSVVKGTDFYLAPEQAIGIISEKNDYYSFGMIILHLLYPEKIDQQTLRKIYERRAAEKPIIDYDTKYKRLNDLIAGLTLQDIQQRWGQKEVSQWLAGKTVEVNYKRMSATVLSPIKVGSANIKTEDDLIDYVQSGDESYRYLIEDAQGYNLLLTWISQVHNLESKQRFDKLMKIAGPMGSRFAREAILRFFRPEQPVQITSQYDLFQTADIEAMTKQFVLELDDHWKISSLRDVTFYLFCYGLTLEQYIDTAAVENKKTASSILNHWIKIFHNGSKGEVTGEWGFLALPVTDEKILQLFYAYNPDRTFRDLGGKSHSTIEEVGLVFAANSGLWNDRFLKTERHYFLAKKNAHVLSGLDRTAFLSKVFESHFMLELDVIDIKPSEYSVSHEVTYKVSSTLKPFFEKQGIRESAKSEIANHCFNLYHVLKNDVESLCIDVVSFVERHHKLPQKRWTIETMETLQRVMAERQKQLIGDASARDQQRMKKDFRLAFKSFVLLLPAVLFYFIILAFFEKSFTLINFLSALTPFEIAVDKPFTSDSASAGLFFLVTLFLSPLWYYILRNAGIGIILMVFLFWVLFGLPIMMFLPLPFAGFCFIGATVWVFVSKANRMGLRPIGLSLIPVLMIVFTGDLIFKDTPPSEKIKHPLTVQAELWNNQLYHDKKLPLRTGPSEDYAIAAFASFKDTITVIAEDSGWYLIRHQNGEGYAPAEKIGLLGYLKTPNTKPSAGIAFPMNFSVTPQTTSTRKESLIRAGTSDEYAVVASFKENETSTVITDQGDWYLIRYQGIEGYVKAAEVKDVVIMKGRARHKNPVLRTEPSFTSETKRNRWNGDFDVLAVHDGWYLIRSYYGEPGYVSKNDIRITKTIKQD